MYVNEAKHFLKKNFEKTKHFVHNIHNMTQEHFDFNVRQ